MNDVERIAEAVYSAVAGIVLRGRGINPQEVVSGLERAQACLEQVKASWMEQARRHLAGADLRELRTEPVQVALSGVDREQVGELSAYKVRKDTTEARAFEGNGWREVKRRYSFRWYVLPDGSGPPAHLTPVLKLLVPARQEVVRLADRLHAARARAAGEHDGLRVSLDAGTGSQRRRGRRGTTGRRSGSSPGSARTATPHSPSLPSGWSWGAKVPAGEPPTSSRGGRRSSRPCR